MIMLFIQLDKPLSQNIYDFLISILPFHALICPFCHHSACLNKHAYYTRKLRNPDGIVELTVLRVVCKSCGHTHVIMPDNIVPYSQVPLESQIDIALCETEDDLQEAEQLNEHLTMQMIRYIHSFFIKYWKQLLISHQITVSYDMVEECFKKLHCQFMQNRRCYIDLFNFNYPTT